MNEPYTDHILRGLNHAARTFLSRLMSTNVAFAVRSFCPWLANEARGRGSGARIVGISTCTEIIPIAVIAKI